MLIGEQVLGNISSEIMTAHEDMLSWTELESYLKQMDEACTKFEHDIIRTLLLKIQQVFNLLMAFVIWYGMQSIMSLDAL